MLDDEKDNLLGGTSWEGNRATTSYIQRSTTAIKKNSNKYFYTYFAILHILLIISASFNFYHFIHQKYSINAYEHLRSWCKFYNSKLSSSIIATKTKWEIILFIDIYFVYIYTHIEYVAPVQKYLEYEISKVHSTDHNKYSPYSGPPSTKGDEAWARLMSRKYNFETDYYFYWISQLIYLLKSRSH